MSSDIGSTAIKRTKSSKVALMLMAKSKPSNWSTSTLLCLFEEKTGARTVIVATEAAMESLLTCDVGRIYDVLIPGKCVKVASGKQTYGHRISQEVHTKRPLTVDGSLETWSSIFKYSFIDWQLLDQKEAGSVVDIIGRVSTLPERDFTSKIDKVQISVVNGEFTTTLDLLGEEASILFEVGDVILCGGLRVKEYRNVRSLQTSFLTIIEINPQKRDGIPAVPPIDNEPKRKVMRISDTNVCSVAELLSLQQQMEQDAKADKAVIEKNVTVTGTLDSFDVKLFARQSPTVGEENLKICLPVNFKDNTGTIVMTLWDKAGSKLLDMSAERLLAMWEDGVEDEDKQDDLLDILNDRVRIGQVRITATVKVRKYGIKDMKYDVQVNANFLEFV